MKKYVMSILLLFLLVPVYAGAKCYVKVKPAKPVHVVQAGPRPGPGHIWVDGRWLWNAGLNRYDWVAGSWMVPPGHYKHWVPGHWKKSRYGWYWVDGHWK